MSALQPIILHGHPGPNPWKIALILEELNIPYTTKIYTTPELKQPVFLAINRNGMAPVIEDPNTGLKLAESGAITDYLLSQYNTTHHLSFPTLQDKSHMTQWLHFQTTTQGPLLQHIFHWDFLSKTPAAHAYYVTSFRRTLQLLNDESSDKEWLVGDKCSAADLSFVPFHSRIGFIMGADAPDVEREFPKVDAWFKRMGEREAVRKVLGDHAVVLERLGFATRK